MDIKKFKNYRIGIELEALVDYDYHSDFTRYVDEETMYKVGEDGSINGDAEGIEIRSNGGLTVYQFTRSLNPLMRLLRKYNVAVNATCGYHVHVSNRDFFNAKNIKRIVFLWSAIEDVMIATQPQSRLNNNYCRRYLLQFLKDERNPIKLPEAKQNLVDALYNRDRYQTLNLQALRDHGTIEIRLHAGTVNRDKVYQWVVLLLHIYKYALTNYKHKDVMELFKTPISEEKIASAFTLIDLPKTTANFYKLRIDTLMFKLLKNQQESAGRVFGNLKVIKKANRQIVKSQKVINDFNVAYQREFETLSSN